VSIKMARIFLILVFIMDSLFLLKIVNASD
jgi:hypothetical protein